MDRQTREDARAGFVQPRFRIGACVKPAPSHSTSSGERP